jgi:signal transduction histidine kinase
MSQPNKQIEQISDLLIDAYAQRVSDLPRSIGLAEAALRLSKEIKNQEYLAKSYSHLSLFHMILGEYDESMRMAELAISIYTDLKDDGGVADAMYNIAGIYYKTNNFHSGLIYLVDCLAIYKNHDDNYNQARVLKSLGTIYEYFGDEASAIDSYKKAVEHGKLAGDKNLQSNAYNPLSGIYLNRNQINRAMDTIKLSLQMKEETGDVRGMAFAIYGRGKVYAKMGLYEEAESDFLESLKIHTEMGEKLGRGMTLNKLGALYLEIGDFQKARDRINEALNYSIESKTAFIKYKAYNHLYLIAKKEDKLGEALSYLEASLQEKEHVINAQTHKIIEAYQVISEKQNLELEAKTQREKADIIEKKNNELDLFFYKVCHDLKSPISAIIGLDDVVRDQITDESSLKYFAVYNKQVTRINDILDDLIKLTKMDHHSESKGIIDFNKLINDCISSFTYLKNFEKVDFNFSVADNFNFKSEWTLINSIVQNLIENAIKYADSSKPKSSICFEVETIGREVHITCRDNGIGIKEEAVKHIFDMFYKEDNQFNGSGLGLYILNRAVEKLHGSVEVQSVQGEGTTMFVSLPLR